MKREYEIRNLKKMLDQSKKKFTDLVALFTNTLNVKLRYEQIIKNLMENEKKSSKDQKTVVNIIKSTKIKTLVDTSKELKNSKREFNSISPSKTKDKNSLRNPSFQPTARGKSANTLLVNLNSKFAYTFKTTNVQMKIPIQ